MTNSSRSKKSRYRNPTRVESLEMRKMLAAVSWDGGGDGANWNDALNWSTDVLPSSSDQVSIVDGQVMMSGAVTVAELFLDLSDLSVSNGTLLVQGQTTIRPESVIKLSNSSTLRIGGTILNSGSIKAGEVGDPSIQRVELSGSAYFYQGTGSTTFSQGSILDLTDLAQPVQLLMGQEIIGATIEASVTISVGGEGQLKNITTTGPFAITYADLAGTFTLGGTLTLGRAGASATRALTMAESTTFTGNQTINVPINAYFAAANLLRFDVGITLNLYRRGTFVGGGGHVSNAGTINIDGSNAAENDLWKFQADFYNEGTVNAKHGARADFVQVNSEPTAVHVKDEGTVVTIDGNFSIVDSDITAGKGATLVLSGGFVGNSASFEVSGTVIIDSGNESSALFSLLKPRVISGYANGSWVGSGIRSTLAASDSRYTVGYAQSSDIVGAGGGMFAGAMVDSSAVILHATLDADFDLNNSVDFNDLLKLGQNFGQSNREFVHGDTNFDGVVDFVDLLRTAQLYGLGFFSTRFISDYNKNQVCPRSVLK